MEILAIHLFIHRCYLLMALFNVDNTKYYALYLVQDLIIWSNIVAIINY